MAASVVDEAGLHGQLRGTRLRYFTWYPRTVPTLHLVPSGFKPRFERLNLGGAAN